ncbi:MAG: PLP-dependent transferase [Oscillospiraceae bacterium]|jgi:O-acetylhomoserine (thiol)-lyase|nr:PLP-dependent transferase [Oscillospiraceae bacterium]MDD3227758.1 PLP-dependent transferase [Oscillospiraceae bacterium]
MTECGFNTALLHSAASDDPQGATLTPIYQCSAFQHKNAEELEQIFANRKPGFSYTRINNPTVQAFERRMTQLEGGVTSVACASGMGALTISLMNLLQSGDEVVAAAGLYGGTVELFNMLEAFGIHTHYVLRNTPGDFEKQITDRTRVLFAETIGNPRLDVTDIHGVADVAHRHGVPLIIDNTVATAYLVQPLKLGADIVVNSSSKYINGNSDAISGVITCASRFHWDAEHYPGMKPFAKFGNMAYAVKLRNTFFPAMGACLSPQNAFLNNLGLETLGLRMERQCANALALAHCLDGMDGITVNYPGLPTSAYYDLAQRQFQGGFGAIITLRTGSRARAFQILDALTLPSIVSNIGDTKTLVIHPASTIAVHLDQAEQQAAGVYEDMIRISVGIEDIEDLTRDFQRAVKGAEPYE